MLPSTFKACIKRWKERESFHLCKRQIDLRSITCMLSQRAWLFGEPCSNIWLVISLEVAESLSGRESLNLTVSGNVLWNNCPQLESVGTDGWTGWWTICSGSVDCLSFDAHSKSAKSSSPKSSSTTEVGWFSIAVDVQLEWSKVEVSSTTFDVVKFANSASSPILLWSCAWNVFSSRSV